MKVAFVLGHTSGKGLEKDKGAHSEYFGLSEWEFYNKYRHYLKYIGDIFTHDDNDTSYSSRQKKMAERTKGYDLVIELHFNSFNGIGNGCEALYYKNNSSTKELSETFCKLMNEHIGIKIRGAKSITYGRGSLFLKSQIPNALILEPFFGDSIHDCKLMDANLDKYFTVVLPELVGKKYPSKIKRLAKVITG